MGIVLPEAGFHAALREAHARLSATNNELQESVAALERSYAATLNAFSGMLDARDSETEGHSQRVVAYAVAIGRGMGLGPGPLAAPGRRRSQPYCRSANEWPIGMSPSS